MAERRVSLEQAVGLAELSRVAEGLSKAIELPVRILDTQGRSLTGALPANPGGLIEIARTDPGDALLSIPIAHDGLGFGTLIIDKKNGNGHADPSDDAAETPATQISELAQSLAGMLADKCYSSLETRSLVTELSTRYEELNLLYDIGRNLTVAKNASKGAQLILDKIRELMSAEYVVLTDPSARVRGFSSHGDASGKGLPGDIRGMAAVSTQIVLSQGQALVIKDVCAPGPVSAFATSPGSLLTALIDTEEKTLGSLSVFRQAPRPPFGSSDVKILIILAAEMALVLKNAELLENLQSLFINIIRTLIFAIEGKDEYTRGHSERVNKFSMLIGKDVGLDDEKLRHLNNSSLLHDIGKIYIPERILCKPEKLTVEEFEIIKTHPSRGAQMLEPINPLREALSGVRHHHEKMDGSGYPDGIGSNDLPIIPRIIAVADIFDAMTSHRAYRPGMTIEQASKIMHEMAGRLIDEELTKLFLDRCTQYYTDVQSDMATRGMVVRW